MMFEANKASKPVAAMAAKCKICTKSVYANDPQINLDGSLFHKPCAKCEDCKCKKCQTRRAGTRSIESRDTPYCSFPRLIIMIYNDRVQQTPYLYFE
jgi:hypothetical protein